MKPDKGLLTTTDTHPAAKNLLQNEERAEPRFLLGIRPLSQIERTKVYVPPQEPGGIKFELLSELHRLPTAPTALDAALAAEAAAEAAA